MDVLNWRHITVAKRIFLAQASCNLTIFQSSYDRLPERLALYFVTILNDILTNKDIDLRHSVLSKDVTFFLTAKTY